MSKYTELREILKEDIEIIVEQRLSERLETLVTALMPGIMQHIANNLKLTVYETDSNGNNEIKTAHLTLQTGPINIQHIGSIKTINPDHYQSERSAVIALYQDLTNRLTTLEHLLSHESKN
jgi:hypothetical protein